MKISQNEIVFAQQWIGLMLLVFNIGDAAYASWPIPHTKGYDFAVRLYSKTPGGTKIEFGFKIEQIESFLEERFGHYKKLQIK